MADGSDGSLDTTDVASVTAIISPTDESPSFSQLAQDISEDDFSDQGSAYDIQQAVGYYLVDHSADAPLENLDDTQQALESALGSQYADTISGDLAGYAANQLQFDPGAITADPPATAADPVNLGTGQFVHTVTDFSVPGAGIDFAFARTYKSGSYYQGPLGCNWDHSANQWIYVNADQSLSLHGGQLRPIPYQLNSTAGSPYFVAAGEDSIIVATASGLYERHWADGRVDQFQNLTLDATLYQIISSADRFGNYISYAYTQSADQYLLASLEVNNSQRLVQFLYDDMDRVIAINLFNATYWTPSGPTVISRQWAYQYDDFGDLVAVTGPATDTFPEGCATQYAYSSESSSARPHDLTAITDPNGDTYLQNTYGTAAGTWAFGRVVSQQLGDGTYFFDWQQVVPDPGWTFSEADAPVSAVTAVQRNGHAIYNVLNAAGNVLLTRETVLGGSGTETLVWRFAYDEDGRKIATLSPEGRVTQTYYGRQYYYDSNYAGDADADLPLPWEDPSLTIAERLTFANVLATVKRGSFFDLTALSDDLTFLGDIFPPATSPNASGPVDSIVKYTYEPRFQQRATTSDARYTGSADPNFPEAASYFAHLTTRTFNPDPGATVAAVTYPSTTYPDGTPGVASAKLTYDSYDPHGRLEQSTDPVGIVFAQSYFPPSVAQPTLEGFLASTTVGVGTLNLTTAFTINEAGLVTGKTDPMGNTTQFACDARSLLRVLTLPMPGYNINTTYDGNGQPAATLTAVVQPDGSLGAGSPELKFVSYNSELSPVLVSFGDSSGVPFRQQRHVYDAANCLIRTVLPLGNSICYEYDERLLLKRTTRGCCDPMAATTTYAYDGDGLRVSTTDPRDNTTAQTLDALGRAIGVVDPLGTLQRLDYDQLDNVTVRRSFAVIAPAAHALLRRTEFLFDERGQLIRTRLCMFTAPIVTADPWNAPDSEYDAALAAGAVELYDSLIFRDGDLRAFRIVDANGHATTTVYDPAGRRSTVSDAVGSLDGYVYDANGNVTRLDHCCADSTGTIQAVISTGQQYDALNRSIGTTDGAGNTTTRGLDSRSLLIEQTDPLGHVTQWSYSPFRERVSETQILLGARGTPPTSLTTSYSYDANGNRLSVTDPADNVTTTAYDVLDRPFLTTNPDQTTRSTSYDPAGNPIEFTDEDGVVVRRTFDVVNRLIAVNGQYATPAAPSAEYGLTMAYNGAGDLIAHQNDFLTVTRSCDSLGRCYSEVLSFAAPLNAMPALTLGRSFDAVSNLTQLQYPSGQTVQYSYDPANRPVAIASVANSAAYPGDPTAAARRTLLEKEWWGDLQIAATLGNGAAVARAFDAAARRAADSCTLPGGQSTTLQQLWDGAGNRALSVDANAGTIRGWLYGYDSTDRLIAAARIRGPALFAPGGIAPPTVRPVVWAPNAQTSIDALIAGYAAAGASRTQYIYDAAGNRAKVTAAAGATAYTTNARNEYLSVGPSALHYSLAGRLAGDARFTYQYNFRGQLVQAQAAAGGTIALQVFHDALGRMVAAIEGRRTRIFVPDAANAIEFYDGGTLSAVNVFEGRDRLCFFASSGRDQYVMRDILESTRFASDGRGAASSYTEYDAFGTLLSGAPATPVRYAGKYLYARLDWYEFMLRQYSPALGRFVQPDPAGFVDGANLFAFLRNNPLSARDPNGTDRQAVSAPAPAPGPTPAPAQTQDTPQTPAPQAAVTDPTTGWDDDEKPAKPKGLPIDVQLQGVYNKSPHVSPFGSAELQGGVVSRNQAAYDWKSQSGKLEVAVLHEPTSGVTLSLQFNQSPPSLHPEIFAQVDLLDVDLKFLGQDVEAKATVGAQWDLASMTVQLQGQAGIEYHIGNVSENASLSVSAQVQWSTDTSGQRQFSTGIGPLLHWDLLQPDAK